MEVEGIASRLSNTPLDLEGKPNRSWATRLRKPRNVCSSIGKLENGFGASRLTGEGAGSPYIVMYHHEGKVMVYKRFPQCQTLERR